jgi:hypothetical protein
VTGRIIAVNVFPPIPDRRFDWCAYHDGDEELAHRYGWGSSEADAVADLARLDEEFAEMIGGQTEAAVAALQQWRV